MLRGMDEPNTTVPVPTDLERCRTIALARPSTLVREAAALDRLKQDVFIPCYAAMRIIDDLIDQDTDDGAAKRRRLDHWLERALQAGRGEAVDRGVEPEDAIFRELARALVRLDLQDKPWRALHRSMMRDLDQEAMRSWSDFETYCEGATVAPTFIYLMLLIGRPDGDGLSCSLAAENVWSHARHLGTFCYLVHIIRDHRADARSGARLLTIPEAAFAPGFATLDDLAGSWAAAELDDPGRDVLRELDRRAGLIEPQARRSAQGLGEQMAPTERRILEQVFDHYRQLRGTLRQTVLRR